ncbi:hypothetical protein D9M72_522360 [compost metagenome]
MKSIPARVSRVPRVRPEMIRASFGSATFHISFIATQIKPTTRTAPMRAAISGKNADKSGMAQVLSGYGTGIAAKPQYSSRSFLEGRNEGNSGRPGQLM